MNILNGTEAFAALAAGQQIECRHMQAGEFDDIRNFPATVYFNPEFEFRIAIKFFQIGEMQVPEPIKEHPAKGAQCFVPSLLTNELTKSFKWKNSNTDLVAFERGQIHLIQEHAEAHALALITVSRGIFKDSQNDTSNDVEEKTSADNTDPQQVEAEAIETDPSKIIEKFTAQIGACTSANSVLALRHTFLANGYLEREHQQHLIKQTENKLIEIDPEQYRSKDENTGSSIENIEQNSLSIDSLKQLQQEAENLVQYQNQFDEYIERVKNAKTPAEANALIRYTSTWTEEQRKPLIDAINARLVELNPPVKDASLSVRILKAEDLTELDALEIDVSTCDEFIQPKLMEMVNKRRAELDPFFNPLGNAS